MKIGWVTAFLDSPSRDVEAFWLAVTGTSLSPRRGDFATLVPADGDACLRVQVLRGAFPRTHLDLHVSSVPAAAREAVGLGASVLLDEGDLVVLRSPAGAVFCLVPWAGEVVRPAPVAWPGGQVSRVDQVCVDVPSAVFDREAGFWSSVTGWPWRGSDLVPGAGMPLGLSLRRVGSEVAGMHLELACDDVGREVERHVGLGAVVVRRVAGRWTTLRDPAGREYCVTGRSPTVC